MVHTPKTAKTTAKRKNNGTRSPTERTLLLRAHDGDRIAFRDLFLRNLPKFQSFVAREIRYYENLGVIERSLLDPRAVVDQVYLAAFHNLKHRSPKMSFRAWLRELALNVTRQQAQWEHNEEPPGPSLERTAHITGQNLDTEFWEFYQPDDVISVEDTVADKNNGNPEDWIEGREMVEEIEGKVNKLDPDLRDVFVLRVIEGLSIEEIAVLKRKPETVIRQYLHDAKEELKQEGVNLAI